MNINRFQNEVYVKTLNLIFLIYLIFVIFRALTAGLLFFGPKDQFSVAHGAFFNLPLETPRIGLFIKIHKDKLK